MAPFKQNYYFFKLAVLAVACFLYPRSKPSPLVKSLTTNYHSVSIW